ncbi:acyl-coenzyme A thioesterase 13 [Orussus abietinus]|uniref:acyl-coenzyme A thioesterase 13 n=1 Tax=Orussus abietinus TaxID=222816 RepID=UPI000625CC3B|nr:acyl-coenzyme A thioesterase 13 [Orussus abietinus]
MPPGSNIAKEVMKRVLNSKGFAVCLKDVNILKLENGECSAEVTVGPQHLNTGGTMHGGFTATLVDCITTYAVITQGNNSPGVSVDIHVSYLKAAQLGDVLSIDARTIRCGRSLAFLEVELKKKDTGQIIARGQHTKYMGG